MLPFTEGVNSLHSNLADDLWHWPSMAHQDGSTQVRTRSLVPAAAQPKTKPSPASRLGFALRCTAVRLKLSSVAGKRPFRADETQSAECGLVAMTDTFSPKSVKDVPKDKFITAYAAHLKANDKVRS